MAEKLDPAIGADSFCLSNPSVWHQTMHLASLEIFKEATMAKITRKQFMITGYLEWLLMKRIGSDKVKIITPSDPNQRGSQLSLVFNENLGDFRQVHEKMRLKGIIVSAY